MEEALRVDHPSPPAGSERRSPEVPREFIVYLHLIKLELYLSPRLTWFIVGGRGVAPSTYC